MEYMNANNLFSENLFIQKVKKILNNFLKLIAQRKMSPPRLILKFIKLRK